MALDGSAPKVPSIRIPDRKKSKKGEAPDEPVDPRLAREALVARLDNLGIGRLVAELSLSLKDADDEVRSGVIEILSERGEG